CMPKGQVNAPGGRKPAMSWQAPRTQARTVRAGTASVDSPATAAAQWSRGSGPAMTALLRESRVRAGLTQHELAERARVSVRTVRALENGAVARPQTASLRRLAAVP